MTDAGSSAVSERSEQLLRRAYRAFNARDIDGALATMHVDVDWPNGMEGGRVRGHQEVREYWTRQFRSIDSQVEPQRIGQAPDGRVIVRVRQLVRDRAGRVTSEQMIDHHYLITQELIARMDIKEC